MRYLRGLMLCTLLALLAACATPTATKQETAVHLWPPAPESARIAWVRSFSRPDDLGIQRTLLQKLKDILFGASEVKLVRPMSVVVQGSATYVADPGAKGVHRFDTANGDYRLIVAENGSPLSSPVGLTRCGSEVLVSDSGRAQLFSLPTGAGGAKPLTLDAPLRQPTGIACDAAGERLFVSDTLEHQIKIFRHTNGTWHLERAFGQRGTEAGEFNFPTYLWWSGERLYVSDALNFRIQVFDGAGQALRQFGKLGDGSGDAARQKGVATDDKGHVYVVDALFHAFQIFDSNGDFLLAVGARGSDPGEFWLPTGIFIDRDLIYVADSYNSRVQVFRYLEAAP